MMHYFKLWGISFPWTVMVLIIMQLRLGFPVRIGSSEEHSVDDKDADRQRFRLSDVVNQLQYSRYLKKVLGIIEDDDTLNSQVDFKNVAFGNLTGVLDYADDRTRTKLDEVKRQELHRIKKISEELKKRGHTETTVRNSVRTVTRHLDLKSIAKFGNEDLRKLILQANAEIAILDNQRKQKFKEYEMHKSLEFEELVKRLKPAEQKEVMNKRNKLLIEHKRKQPSHMPASKAHLLKVWEERDQMNKENFNIRTFFHLHDLDGNGFLVEYEIKILLENEIGEQYDSNAPDFDPKEKQEELERMREYAFKTIDLDNDHLIDVNEFIENTKRTGYEDHTFWENINRVPVFTDVEYAIYANANRAEVNKMIDEGRISLPPSGIVQHNEGVTTTEKTVDAKKVDGHY